MTLPRRKFLSLVAGAGALPALPGFAAAQAPAKPQPAKPARPLAERLAAYASELRYDDLDPATIERVKAFVIDTLGCGIAAFNEKPVQICRDLALVPGGGVSSVIGTNKRTTPDLASFANGAAFRYYDLNDVYVGRTSAHPSDNIAPCLAIAEAEHATAHDLITAIALVYEVTCRLIDAIDIGSRGWDPPVLSLPAVALAAGKLMKLSPEKLTHAVNLAVNDHIAMGQTRAQTNSDWKGFADAEASRNAVFATMLARGGLTGPAPIFEGRVGFFKQVASGDVDVEAFGRRGVPFRIDQCGMKPYAAVVYGQTAIVAAIAVAKEVGDLTRISAIEIATTRRGFQQTGSDPEKWTPATRDTADHSLPYLTMRAMFDGDIDNDSYAPEKLRDPRALAFMRKITVSEDPVLTARTGPSTVPTRITAILADGQRVVREVDDVPGFVSRPMGREDIERKFRKNVGKRWPQERTDAILAALWTLEQTDDLSALLGKLSLQPKS
jgi:2-methylcitrate dehydratase